MLINNLKHLIVTCSSCISVLVCSTCFATPLGEHHGPDTIGGPGTPSHINDSRREPKPHAEPHHQGSADDPRPVKPPKPTAPPAAAPVAAPPTMDRQAIIAALSLVSQNPTMAPSVTYYFGEKDKANDPKVGVYAAGIGALIDAAKWAKDLNTLGSAQAAITKFEMTMKPGEMSHILVSATPEGKVEITKLTSPDAPVLSDGKSNSFRATISAPNIVQTTPKTDEQRLKELHDFFESLDKEQKNIINQERKRLGLSPM